MTAHEKILFEALKEMKWFVDHIMGKEKRVNWGHTFDIDWGRVNSALIQMEEALKKVGSKNEQNVKN